MKHARGFVLFPRPVHVTDGLVWIKELQTGPFEEHMQANCMSSLYGRFGSWPIRLLGLYHVTKMDQSAFLGNPGSHI